MYYEPVTTKPSPTGCNFFAAVKNNFDANIDNENDGGDFMIAKEKGLPLGLEKPGKMGRYFPLRKSGNFRQMLFIIFSDI